MFGPMYKYVLYTKEKGKMEFDNFDDYLKARHAYTKHRLDGPARIGYYEDGSIRHMLYFVNNKMHRLDGAAYIEYYEDGSIMHGTYLIDDEQYTPQQYLNLLYEIKAMHPALRLTDDRWYIREYKEKL